MNILSLSSFKLLKTRSSKLRKFLDAQDAAKKEMEQNWGGTDQTAYTLVDLNIGGNRKCDLLTSVYMGSKHLDSAKTSHKTGKARWHQHSNQQTYIPKVAKIDKQLEYVWEELDLNREMEQTIIGAQQQAI